MKNDIVIGEGQDGEFICFQINGNNFLYDVKDNIMKPIESMGDKGCVVRFK